MSRRNSRRRADNEIPLWEREQGLNLDSEQRRKDGAAAFERGEAFKLYRDPWWAQGWRAARKASIDRGGGSDERP